MRRAASPLASSRHSSTSASRCCRCIACLHKAAFPLVLLILSTDVGTVVVATALLYCSLSVDISKMAGNAQMCCGCVLQAEKDGGDTDTDTGANEDDRGGTPAPFEEVKDKTAADMLADAAAEVAPSF
jgi:hypothetical protein